VTHSATGDKAQLLLQAANALNVGGGEGGISHVTSEIRRALGLSELGIETEQENTGNGVTEHTAFVLGKYLTPKLYINYSIGILDPINTLRIRYAFTKTWAIQSTTNSLGNGVDLLYTVERN